MVFYTNVIKYCERFVPGNVQIWKGKQINWSLMCLVIQHVKIPGSPFLPHLSPSHVQKQRSQFAASFACGRHYKALALVLPTFLARSSVQILLLEGGRYIRIKKKSWLHPPQVPISVLHEVIGSVPLLCQLQRTLLQYLIKDESFLWLPQTYIISLLQCEDEVKVLQSPAMVKCFWYDFFRSLP